ncbi:hypothetical protein HDV00_011909 [Rhizophlyctis rosea]|nr:hypothetical protein HDV00_011909 [Rhizophlyctis rosea]
MQPKLTLSLAVLAAASVNAYYVKYTWSDLNCKGSILSQQSLTTITNCEPVECRNQAQASSQSYSITCVGPTMKGFPSTDYGLTNNTSGQTYAVFESYPSMGDCNADQPNQVFLTKGDNSCQALGTESVKFNCLNNGTIVTSFFNDTSCAVADGDPIYLPTFQTGCLLLNATTGSASPNVYCVPMTLSSKTIPYGTSVSTNAVDPSTNSSSSSSPTASSDSSKTSSSGSQNLAGPIAGGVIGVLVIIAAAGVIIWWMKKKNRNAQANVGGAYPPMGQQQQWVAGGQQPAQYAGVSMAPPEVPHYHVK